MEKYTKYRDKGSGIAPFFPIPSNPSGIYFPLHALLFAIRLPLLLCAISSYFLLFSWLLPHGSFGRKAILWAILGIPGVWWVDLQVDGVKRGWASFPSLTLSLVARKLKKRNLSTLNATTSAHRLPRPGTVIASSCTSPLDALYLAAIFDPIILRCFPSTRRVQQISLPHAILFPLLPDSLSLSPDPAATTTTLSSVVAKTPYRPILVFPESSPTNGRAILPLSPALLAPPPPSSSSSSSKGTPIFPTSLRYSPADITTPVPGHRAAWWFVWNLCKAPSHTIRVRIAEAVYDDSPASSPGAGKTGMGEKNGYATNFFDRLDRGNEKDARNRGGALVNGEDGNENTRTSSEEGEDEDEEDLKPGERRVLDRVGEALARLGRVKRVALGVRDKIEFVDLWRRRSHRR